jgi:SAM-dependent methyltransferase
MLCRHCSSLLTRQILDLGATPPANNLLAREDQPETRYSLRLLRCDGCGLVQTDIDLFRLDADEVFSATYPYFSSSHPAFVAHAKQYAGRMIERLNLGPDSLVVEIGSNDGYLLQHFKARGIRVLGVEPTQTGATASVKGIETLPVFFDEVWAERISTIYGQADLVVCNNVLAHVPDINGFCRGIKMLLKSGHGREPGTGGVVTFEFPSLLKLVQGCQWDTVYHEHYSYLSFKTARDILRAAGLHVHDVEHIPTHGGSLRMYANNYGRYRLDLSVLEHLQHETSAGMGDPAFYLRMQEQAANAADALRTWLEDMRVAGKRVAGFGAAAKGNTLLNYAGIDEGLLPYIVDDTPAKQGKFAPGSRIPIVAQFDSGPKGKPDAILVLPWNWLPQIKVRLADQIKAGATLVTAIPTLQVQ